jgi:UDP-N-acetylglucosamine 3-dehydrogenase
MRVGILGAGFIGSIHAKAYLQIPDAQIAAVCDIDRSSADRLATSVNSEACYDPEALLARPDVDAVDICLPTHLHEYYVVLAAQNRKHILCEKPVALQPESIDRMAQAIEEAGVAGMVAQVLRFWP